MKNCATTVFFCLMMFSTAVKAQTRQIRGSIRSSGIPHQGISVMLLKATDSSIVKTAITDSNGHFVLDEPLSDTYFLSAAGTGLQTYYGSGFVYDSTDKVYNVPAIEMPPVQNELNAAEIVYTRPLIEKKADRLIINTGKMITAASGSAFDMLPKLPGVRVSPQDEISINNKPGVLLVLDNQHTNAAISVTINILKNMPATEIERIEVIFAPSARYDAAGHGGIINMITKKGLKEGFNANLTAGYTQGYSPKSNLSIQMNYRKNKWNIFGSVPVRFFSGPSEQTMERKVSSDTTKDHLLVSGNSTMKQKVQSYAARFGAEHYISSGKTLSMLLHSNTSEATVNTHALNRIYRNNIPEGSFNTRTDFKLHSSFISGNINYSQDLSHGSLSADIDYGRYTSVFSQLIHTHLYDKDFSHEIAPSLSFKSRSPVIAVISAAKVDYTYQSSKEDLLEVGIKSAYSSTDNAVTYQRLSNSSWENDGRGTDFRYTEYINAAYLNATKTLEKWALQAGIRMEHTNRRTATSYIGMFYESSFTDFFPSGTFNYKFNDNNSLSLYYNKRIQRPPYESLNPFTIFLDSLSGEQGNPNLQPEYSHNTGLNMMINNSLQVALSYGRTNNVISKIAIPSDNENVTILMESNISRMNVVDLSASYSFGLAQWWQLFCNASLGYTSYKGNVNSYSISVGSITGSAGLTNMFQWEKGWNAEISMIYNGPSVDYTLSLMRPILSANLGVSKSFWNDKGKLQLAVNDIFWVTYNSDASYANVNFKNMYRMDSRTAGLIFSWKFGNRNIDPERHRQTALQEEKQRLRN